jgi:hypothetical protein
MLHLQLKRVRLCEQPVSLGILLHLLAQRREHRPVFRVRFALAARPGDAHRGQLHHHAGRGDAHADGVVVTQRDDRIERGESDVLDAKPQRACRKLAQAERAATVGELLAPNAGTATTE